MPTPDVRPPGETLGETVLWSVRRREELEDAMAAAAEHLASGVTGRVDVAWTALSLALDAYRDAVAAEARAALLAGAPEVWIGRDDEGAVVALDRASGTHDVLPDPFDSICRPAPASATGSCPTRRRPCD